MSEEFYDPINGLKVLVKYTTDDEWVYTLDASEFDQIKAGQTLDSVVSGPTVDIRGKVAGSVEPTIGTPSVGSKGVQAPISGGTNGEQYMITTKISTSSGEVITLKVMLYVEDPSIN